MSGSWRGPLPRGDGFSRQWPPAPVLHNPNSSSGSASGNWRSRSARSTNAGPFTVSKERVEEAVVKGKQEVLLAGKSVGTWELVRMVSVALRLDFSKSLWYQLQDVPSFKELSVIEGKVNAFMHCFVNVWKVTTVHELNAEICKAEGVEQFEELGLGPLLRHPLVVHYFSVPEDASEIIPISTADIIAKLDTYLYKIKNGAVVLEEFLDYLAGNFKVEKREKLGVRIRSLGLHIKYVRDARRIQADSLLTARQVAGLRSNKQPSQERDDEPTSSSTIHPVLVQEKPSHTHAQIKDETSEDESELFYGGSDLIKEMEMLGLKPKIGALGGSKSKRKKPVPTVPKAMDLSKKRSVKVFQGIKDFITTWQEACQRNSARKVLEMMMLCEASNKQRHALKVLFLQNPCYTGLLNFFVALAKLDILDSLYNSLDVALGPKAVKSGSGSCHMVESSLVSKQILMKDKCDKVSQNHGRTDLSKQCISIEDIVNKIANYFKINPAKPNENAKAIELFLSIFKSLSNCEIWLANQFSVEQFSDLGFGSFSVFLETNLALFPSQLLGDCDCEVCNCSRLAVSIDENQLRFILSQVGSRLCGKDSVSGYNILSLLNQQFPTVSFQITGSEVIEKFSDLISKQRATGDFCSIMFSATLLGHQRSALYNGKVPLMPYEEDAEPDCFSGVLETVSAEDATECLLKAPMLSDLVSWCHWDLLFAPLLGSLVDWLLNRSHVKELLCIVTAEGKLIRVQQSTTPDEFLDASAQGDSFQAALKLLSLLCLYGSSGNFPFSLLKNHAKRAINILVKNSVDLMDSETSSNSVRGAFHELVPCKYPCGDILPNNYKDACLNDNLNTRIDYSCNKGANVPVKFVFDCICNLPSEFRCLAAQIFVPGLQCCVKNAPLAILHECRGIEDRIMLHDMGLSLGVMEWVNDYYSFRSEVSDLKLPLETPSDAKSLLAPMFDFKQNQVSEELVTTVSRMPPMVAKDSAPSQIQKISHEVYEKAKTPNECKRDKLDKISLGESSYNTSFHHKTVCEASRVIESIRHEEFGLDSKTKSGNNSLIEKQHARLGRALHCLSQELYSQDSHLLLELVQNADDNTYPGNVEPTLVFILQPTGIVVLNNEEGFSAHNFKALCDIGNSTKKGSNAGYIGKKGIGFKSVFRVTESPEIHSNGFHVKFDTAAGPIGYILPTEIEPCDVCQFSKLLSSEQCKTDATYWRTCIVLPFRSDIKEKIGINSITSMFSDLHPSLLLFLHRLQCIRFKNTLNDTLIVMRREILEDGIVKVSYGSQTIQNMIWLVVGENLPARSIRPDIENTEISVAFPLQESANGYYQPYIFQQPVFAFLPLRTYGLKFIVQGDFVLPSSREEVDGDSTWNQWLLSKLPALFVKALRSFCALKCFKNNPGEAVTAFMQYVPLVGEVFGFFSPLAHMIIAKLRTSNCLVVEGKVEWAPPYKILRGWNDEVYSFISDELLMKHAGLRYLRNNIKFPDALSKALGISEYGPKILTDVMLSVSRDREGIKLLGIDWMSYWLNAFSSSLNVQMSWPLVSNSALEIELFKSLRTVPIIPLADGSYSSVTEGSIWLPCDVMSSALEGTHNPKDFPLIYSKLRLVSPRLFSALGFSPSGAGSIRTANMIQLLLKLDVKQLSAHEIITHHILPSLSEFKHTGDTNWRIEYLVFIMIHFQYKCCSCRMEKDAIILELRKKSLILTNHGYKCPALEPIHFGKTFGSTIDIKRLISDIDTSWHLVDEVYMQHQSVRSLTSVEKTWREFFLLLGICDFVQVVSIERELSDYHDILPDNLSASHFVDNSKFMDWESPELVHLLSEISSQNKHEHCKYLLEILDKMWDDCFSEKCHVVLNDSSTNKSTIRSSFLESIQKTKWVFSSLNELHYPTDVFYDCEAIRSVLGSNVPYTIPQVSSKKFLKDVGIKTRVVLNDAFALLSWGLSNHPFKASIIQMTNLYNAIWEGIQTLDRKFTDELKSNSIVFIPSNISKSDEYVSGTFFSSRDVYWQDPIGCLNPSENAFLLGRTLSRIYPSLHDFFVKECGVPEKPDFGSYFSMLLELRSSTSPLHAGYMVYQILLKWADDLKMGIVKPEEISSLKKNLGKLENTVLPTIANKWVSLHAKFGIVCWPDDEELKNDFQHVESINFLHLGELSIQEKHMLPRKVAFFLQEIGIPVLSEVLTREAVYYGMEDNRDKTLLINWVLPYIQRYLLKFHPDEYGDWKWTLSERFSHLQVVVVEKLYHRYTLKGLSSVSNKRSDCCCLLQGNVLYMTQASDSHTIFMELSRIFFEGSIELHLANFLDTIVTKAKSGCTEKQIEFFIANNQKLPELSVGEPIWSIVLSSYDDVISGPHMPASSSQRNFMSSTRSLRPKKNYGDLTISREIGMDLFVEETSMSMMTSIVEKPKQPDVMSLSEELHDHAEACNDTLEPETTFCGVDYTTCRFIESSDNKVPELKSALDSAGTIADSAADISPSFSSVQDTGGYFQILNDQQSWVTGRLGEVVAYKHFCRKHPTAKVSWVNEVTETGWPYDLVMGEDDSRQYIEVKSTSSATKDWFPITTREWQFATEKGDAFSIAFVVLEASNKAKISVFRNPFKLCQKNVLNLIVSMSQMLNN